MKSNTLFSIFSFTTVFFLSLPPPTFSFRCNPDDYQVLLKIKAALGNPYHLASWVEGTECCYWYCLECNHKNRVTELTIFNGEISGQIPSAVGDLPYLEHLTFRKLTNLTGPIPEAISKLTNLNFLWLSYTNLTGPVPSFLSKLTNLTYINFSFNDHTGSIPSSLSNLQKLEYIDLSRNKLTGKIPDSFGKFGPSMQYIILKKNQLTGPIPKSLGNLQLQTLDVSYNRLCGPIPTSERLQSLGETAYFHNKCLCGPPLPACKKSL